MANMQELFAQHRFATEAEVDEYLAHEKIECLVCGNRYKSLWRHLRLAHGIAHKDYHLALNIPRSKPLFGTKTKKRFAAINDSHPEQGERLAAMAKTAAKLGGTAPRTVPQMSYAIRGAWKKTRHVKILTQALDVLYG